MSLIFMDGFDNKATSDMIDKWDAVSTITACNNSFSRWPTGNGVQMSSAQNLTKTLGSNYATLVVGLAVYLWSGSTLSTTNPFFELLDGTTSQLKFCFDDDEKLRVYRGDNTLLATSTNVFPIGEWHHVEIKAVIDNSSGSVEVKVDGVSTGWINITSQDTQNSANAYANKVVLRGINGGQGWYDDFYLDNSTQRGECRIRTFFPDSDGTTHNDFTASAGSRYQCVDETSPNDDTDYVYSGTLNNKQTFEFTTGVLPTVVGVQLNNYLKKDDVSIRKVKGLIRSNGSDYLSSNEYNTTTSYKFLSDIWETDPDDSNAWTQAKLESREFGLQITADS